MTSYLVLKTAHGTIKAKLCESDAPEVGELCRFLVFVCWSRLICSNTSLARCNLQTCKAVKKLVADGCYDKCVFYRAEPGFVVQGGLKRSDGAKVKSPIKSIPLEVSRPNVRGSLTMARWEEPTSGSGEFFIVIADEAPHLDKTGDSGERFSRVCLWLWLD